MPVTLKGQVTKQLDVRISYKSFHFLQPSVASEMTGQSFYAASSASMYGGFSRSVFGSVSGRSSPESVSEDLAEPSSGFRDKFTTSLGGNNVSSRRGLCKVYEQGATEQHLFCSIYGDFICG